MIFKKNLSEEELKVVLKECLESDNMMKSLIPVRMYNMAKETHRRNEQEIKVKNALDKENRKYIKNIIVINDDLAIVETYEDLFGKGEESWFSTYINGHIDSTVCSSLDEALLLLVARKNNMKEASQWMARMIGLY